MLEVDQSYLSELKRLNDDEEYPEWAQKIDVPTPDAEVSTMGTVAKEIRAPSVERWLTMTTRWVCQRSSRTSPMRRRSTERSNLQ